MDVFLKKNRQPSWRQKKKKKKKNSQKQFSRSTTRYFKFNVFPRFIDLGIMYRIIYEIKTKIRTVSMEKINNTTEHTFISYVTILWQQNMQEASAYKWTDDVSFLYGPLFLQLPLWLVSEFNGVSNILIVKFMSQRLNNYRRKWIK